MAQMQSPLLLSHDPCFVSTNVSGVCRCTPEHMIDFTGGLRVALKRASE
jgi:hypothetical protein